MEPMRGHGTQLSNSNHIAWLRAVLGSEITYGVVGSRKGRPVAGGTALSILNRLSARTAKGHTWTQQRVRAFRNDHGITVYRDGERAERGEVTLEEAGRRLGVSKMTVIRLIKDCLLPAKQTCIGAPYVIRQTDLELPAVRRAIQNGPAISQDPRQGTPEYQ